MKKMNYKMLLVAALGSVVTLTVPAADNGEEIVAKAEAAAPAASSGEFVPAKEKVEAFLESLGLDQAYKPENKSMIKIGVAYKKIQDPANDKKYSALRTLKYMEAYLNAKAEIIRSIEQDMSAMDRAETFGEFIDGETPRDIFAGKMEKYNEKVQSFIKKIEPVNKKVAEALSVAVDSSFGAALDDAVAAFGETSALENQKDQEIQQLRDELQKLQAEYSQLAKDEDKKQMYSDKIKGFLVKVESKVRLQPGVLSDLAEKDCGKALSAALAAFNKGDASASSNEGNGAGTAGQNSAPAQTSVDVAGNQLKRELEALKAEYATLFNENKKLSEQPSAVQESATKTMSRMPILGATVLGQFESWDQTSGEYQIAVACVWSAKLEEKAKQLAMGNFVPAAKKGPCSVTKWVKGQDLSCMIGSRQFIDDRGRTIFLGIGAREEPKSISLKKAVERQVAVEASRNVAFALMGDVKAFSETKSMNTESGDESTTAESVTDKLSQKLDANLKGLSKLMDKTVKSPITGKKMMVSVYYLDPNLAQDSAGILKKAYEDMMQVTRATQRARGRHAGFDEALKEQRESTAEANKAKGEAKQELKEAVDAAERTAPASTGPAGSKKEEKAKSTGGVFGGDKNVNTDF